MARPRASVFIATSLDGFIARSNGDIDWLESGAIADEDYGYKAFFESVDTLVFGRRTFEKVLSFRTWPYGGKRVVVLSATGVTPPKRLANRVRVTSDPPTALVELLAAEGARHLYVDGGLTIQSFLRAGLVDEMTITVLPVLLGQGLPLFGPLAHDVRLTHLATQAYHNGFVQHRYRVEPSRAEE